MQKRKTTLEWTCEAYEGGQLYEEASSSPREWNFYGGERPGKKASDTAMETGENNEFVICSKVPGWRESTQLIQA